MLIVNQFYWPSEAATAQLMTDLAEGLAARGWEVTVLCGSGGYLGGGTKLPCEEVRNGVLIKRLPTARRGKRSMADRLADYASFYWQVFRALRNISNVDVCMFLTTPPLIGLLGPWWRRHTGKKYICQIQDVYPDIAVALGVIRPGLLEHFLKNLNAWAISSADGVVVVGETMAERLASALPASEKVAIIHNWADGRSIVPLPKEDNRFVREHGLNDQFVVLYSGNMGMAHTFETVLQAALKMRNERDVLFLFIGDGEGRKRIDAFKRDKGLENIRLLPYQPRERLLESLGAGDLHLITLREGVEGLVVPSKLYGIMAAGRPILYIGPMKGDIPSIIAKNRIGTCVNEHDIDGFVAAVRRYRNDRTLAEDEGRTAREVFEKTFDRPHAEDAYDLFLRRLVGSANERLNTISLN